LTILQTGLQKSTQFGETQHTDTISGIQWSPDGSTFAVASMDYKLIFYVSGFVVEFKAGTRISLRKSPLTEAGTEWQDPAHTPFRQHPAQRLRLHSRRETRRRDLHQQQAGFGGQ
jgi:WD40 repeat protein